MIPRKKFLFDTDFDDTEKSVVEVEEKPEDVAEDEEIEEAAPTFNEEDVEEARVAGFAAGRKEGIEVASEAVERQVQETLAKMAESMNRLFDIQDKANDAMARNAVEVAVAIAAKAFPDLGRQNALGEVERVVGLAMEKAVRQPRMVIGVDQALHDPLAQRIDALIAESGYQGKVELVADAGLPAGDCRIEWEHGGAERDQAAIRREIDEIVRRNLGTGDRDTEQAPAGQGDRGEDDDRPANTGGDHG